MSAAAPFAHIEDLKLDSKEGYSPFSGIPTLLDVAERSLGHSKTLVDFRRPDGAYVEFLRAYEILVEVVPHHKDNTHFRYDQPNQARRLLQLQTRVNADVERYMNIKEIIINDNKRTGARPRRGQSNGGHTRTESAPAAQMAPKIRPVPSPKPDSLHGRAISTATAGANGTKGQLDPLRARFAGLRMDTSSQAANASSVHSSPTSVYSLTGDSFENLSNTTSLPSRPSGPRSMPNGGLASIQIPNFPQAPPTAYSPARNMQTTGNIALPRHTARSLAPTRRASMGPPSTTAAQAPNGSALGGDYFPATVPNNSIPTGPQYTKRRTSVKMPAEPVIGAERFHDYLDRFNVLIIDFRTRELFDEGHIYARNVMCVEPFTMRQGMSAENLTDTLVVSPEYEQELFAMRDKYDLVVYYDNDTQAAYPFANVRQAKLKYLHEALWDFNQEKQLQRPPVLLLGGLEAWTNLVGQQALLTTNTKVKAEKQGIQRRPVATTRTSGNSQLKIPKRRLRNYDSPDEEEEQFWREKVRQESIVLPPMSGLSPDGQHEADGMGVDSAANSAVREFRERFPEAGDLDSLAFAGQLPSRTPPLPPAKVSLPSYPPPPPLSAYPSAPARPVPAAPRMSYTGVSNHLPSASTQSARSTSSQLAPYVPPKYLASNLRLPRVGLYNFGNTCYMNATLQALSATTPLSVHFMNDAFKSRLQRGNWKGSKTLLTESYAALIRSLWKADAGYYMPDNFRGVCKTYCEAFNNNDQQDAKEFFDYLLDTLHEDLNETWAKPPLRVLTEKEEAQRERMPKTIVASTEWERYTHRNLSFVNDLFAGQHASKVTCLTCNFTSTTYEAFTSLSIEIPDKRTGLWSGALPSLQDCLRSYCSEERLTGEDNWHCTRCKTKREALKRITLTRAPKSLVVHFKRFTAQQGSAVEKNRITVDFPLANLDLAPYMLVPPTVGDQARVVRDYGPQAADMSMTPPYRYDAYAVVKHLGRTLQSGHYITVAKDCARGGRWYEYDDQTVRESLPDERTPGRMRSGDAYIVFYQRVAPVRAAAM
ncbi:hypothetical protein LTR08_002105 [Meristemomyces frigidus]|nr:hypothetical protein LTR08_002105 [Meristemomyces frigidus]